MKLSCFKKNALLKSILINLIFFILAILFCDQKYEVSDDFMIDAVLSGAYGDTYNPVMLFSNIFLGKFLIFLYKIIPVGSIYFYYLVASSFICLVCITYLIHKKNNTYLGILISVILISFFSDDLYISITYTKVAALQIITGGVIILYSFDSHIKSKRIISLSIGSALFLLGSFLRFECVPIALGFLFILFFINLLKTGRNTNSLHCLIFCLLIVILSFGLEHIDHYIRLSSNNDREYYLSYQDTNSVINLYKFDYNTMKPTYDELGLSENDFQMLYLWNFVDDEVFPQSTITVIGNQMKQEVYNHTKNISFCLNKIAEKKFYMYPSVWGLILLSFIFMLFHRQKWGYSLSILLLCLCFIYYCVFTGKLPYRVEYCIFLCAAISTTSLIQVQSGNNRLYLILCILLVFLKIPLYNPDYSYKYMNASDYYDYVLDAMTKESRLSYNRYTVDLNHRRILGNLIDTMEQDSEHYYLIAFNPYMQILYYNYKPWERIPIGYLINTYNYVGGVNYMLKYSDNALLVNGIDPQNPNKSLIDNENLIWVEAFPDLESTFLAEHYCHTLQSNYLGSIDYADLWQFTSY